MSLMNIGIEVNYLTVNKYSRPGRELKSVDGIVIHWVANPKTSALDNWRFFDSRQYGGKGFGGAHYIVGLEGEVIQCMPTAEMAYHTGSKTYTDLAKEKFGTYPNNCTLGIEMCHIDWMGYFTMPTLQATAELCRLLCNIYKLNSYEDVVTHHQVVGWKDCPRWFTNHPGDFVLFKQKIKEAMEGEHDIGSKTV